MKKRSVSVICICPPNLLAGAKAADMLEGYHEKRGIHFSAFYTSRPELIREIGQTMVVVLYLPATAGSHFQTAATKFIRKFSRHESFFLVTNDARFFTLRHHPLNMEIPISVYFSTLGKAGAAIIELAA